MTGTQRHWTCWACTPPTRFPVPDGDDTGTRTWRSHYASAHPDGAGKKPTNGEGVT